MQDIKRTVVAFRMVRDADGCIIEEQTMRSGRRFETKNGKSKNLGGKSVKKNSTEYSPPAEELHHDLFDVRRELLARAVARSNQHRDRDNNNSGVLIKNSDSDTETENEDTSDLENESV